MVFMSERVGQHLETFNSCYYSYLSLKRIATAVKALRHLLHQVVFHYCRETDWPNWSGKG